MSTPLSMVSMTNRYGSSKIPSGEQSSLLGFLTEQWVRDPQMQSHCKIYTL